MTLTKENKQKLIRDSKLLFLLYSISMVWGCLFTLIGGINKSTIMFLTGMCFLALMAITEVMYLNNLKKIKDRIS